MRALAALLKRSPQAAQVGAIREASRPYDSNAGELAEIKALPDDWPFGMCLIMNGKRFRTRRLRPQTRHCIAAAGTSPFPLSSAALLAQYALTESRWIGSVPSTRKVQTSLASKSGGNATAVAPDCSRNRRVAATAGSPVASWHSRTAWTNASWHFWTCPAFGFSRAAVFFAGNAEDVLSVVRQELRSNRR